MDKGGEVSEDVAEIVGDESDFYEAAMAARVNPAAAAEGKMIEGETTEEEEREEDEAGKDGTSTTGRQTEEGTYNSQHIRQLNAKICRPAS